jgi:hypothetical protein
VRQLEPRVQAAVRRGAGLLLVPRAQAEAARAALQGPSAGSGAQAVAQVVAAASIRDALDHLA